MLTLPDIKNIKSLTYHFEEENLDLEISEPLTIEILDTGHHIITDPDGSFVIRPIWVYISIIKREPQE